MDTTLDAKSQFAAIDKLSDLVDYAIKDFEASGLDYQPAHWLFKDCGCLAGGVMHQTFGIRSFDGSEFGPAKADERKAIQERLWALSEFAFGHIQAAASYLGQSEPGLPNQLGPAWTVEDLKARLDYIRLLGL